MERARVGTARRKGSRREGIEMRIVCGLGSAVVVSLLGTAAVSAQSMRGAAPAVIGSGPAVHGEPVSSGGVVYGTSWIPGRGVIYPYSYAVTAPLPARGYVGYGANDIFPYYGRPYGHAYDKYSWSTLSGSGSLARYYYPPVR
jgi:hypothetical protein